MILTILIILWIGLFMILIGFFLVHKIKKPPSLPYKITASKIYLHLRYLYPGENTSMHLEKMFTACLKQVLLCYAVGTIFLTVIYFTSLYPEKVTNLNRPGFRSSSSKENLQVSVDGGKLSDISISLAPKELSASEIINIYDSIDPYLLETLLDDNESLEHVDRPLNFVHSVSNEETGYTSVFVSWDISDNSVISNDGQINYDNADADGTKITITASLQLDGYDLTASRKYIATVFPYEKSKLTLIEEAINEQLNNSDNLNSLKINLPDKILGYDITFYHKNNGFPLILFPLFVIVLFMIVFSRISDIRSRMQKRNSQLLHDYPEIVSKLTLLYCAGLNIRSSFQRIVSDYDRLSSDRRYAYEEMKLMLKSIDNGTSEGTAYIDFGHNCVHPCYIKLGTLLAQNLKRGSGEVYSLLEYEAIDSLQEKKALIKISGEKASTKALFPMVLMLLVVFIIIMAPAFMSI
ncbi:MAG: type II secretion system F family protein [Lachnospiraceae bacterium]|nr:type II secretion system F family protein [Lachnospiraceae bacterium]